MRAFFLPACVLALVACGPSPSSADSDSAEGGAVTLAQSDAEPAALADDGASSGDEAEGLPAAYQDADINNGRQNWFLCAACHQIGDGTKHAVGPDLHGVFGRAAASNPTFPLYSPGLKDSGIVWSAEAIDAWIANPRDVIPTTTMIFPGIRDADDRRDLIAYLWQEAGASEE